MISLANIIEAGLELREPMQQLRDGRSMSTGRFSFRKGGLLPDKDGSRIRERLLLSRCQV